MFDYYIFYNDQINASALIGQSAMVYYATKLMEKLRLLNHYLKAIDHKFLWFRGVKNHFSGMLEDHSPAARHVFTNSSRVLPTSRVVYQRSLRERFDEHLRSINKNAPRGFPVAEHFSPNAGPRDQTLRWEQTELGRGRRCVSFFVSGHASRPASILIFSSFKFARACTTQHINLH